MPDDYKYDIFISYARRDGGVYAAQLEVALAAEHFKTWRDTRNIAPNQDFSAELERAIEDSAQVVCCITPDVRRDDSFVRREIGFALAVQKPVIPLIFADTIPPISIVNVTREDFTHTSWNQAVSNLCVRLQGGGDRTYVQVFPPADPYRDYLHALYKQIVAYLDHTVFTLIPLRSADTPEMVEEEASQRNVLPMIFFDIAGIKGNNNAPTTFAHFHEAFDRYDGRVLLLGEPGAGKTTTLFAFARDQVARRLEDPERPLPILASLSTWNAQVRTPLAKWLANEIKALKADEIANLMQAGRVLLLLDGLDELGLEREDPQTQERYDPRVRLIETLSGSTGPDQHAQNLIVVTCRRAEYVEIGAKISLDGAVTLEPLNDSQLHNFLRDLPDLWAALVGDDDLREVARTPLLLSLFTFAYRDQGEAAAQLLDLRGSSRSIWRDEIFRQYVERRYWHEKRKIHADLPFTLKEIYDVLGRVAMENAGKDPRRGSEEKVLRNKDFTQALKAEFVLPFLRLATQLHLIATRDEISYRFIHLLLRDHFAFGFALRHLHVSETESNIRRKAAWALGRLGDNRAVEALIAALDDVDAKVCLGAAWALGQLGDSRAVEPLLITLDNMDARIRRKTTEVLGELRDIRAVEPLIAILDDTDTLVRRRAARALEQLRDTRAVGPLITAAGDANAQVRQGAARALGELGDKRAVEALIMALEDVDAGVRGKAAKALGKLGDMRAVNPLIAALGDTSAEVRRRAAEALKWLGDMQAIDPLIAALNDANAGVRQGVAWALGELGDTRAVEPLIAALQDTDNEVRWYAAGALSKIYTPEARAAQEAWRKLEGKDKS